MANCQLAHRICNSLKSCTKDFAGVFWKEKANEDPYWRKKFEHGIEVIKQHFSRPPMPV